MEVLILLAAEAMVLVTSPDQANSRPSGALSRVVVDVIRRFVSMSAVRDAAVTDGRQVVRVSANAVRVLHRGEDATGLLTSARTMMFSIAEKTLPYLNIYWAGYVQDAMKEYAEAEITAALLRGKASRVPRIWGG